MKITKLWDVVGIDDLEGNVFAQCTTRQIAKKAMRILEAQGFENMLEIRENNLGINRIITGGKAIEFQEKHLNSDNHQYVKENSVSEGYLQNWYQDSVLNSDSPVWTDEHIDELYGDFYLIPKEVIDGKEE